MTDSNGDKKLTEDEDGGRKRSSKKKRKEDSWQPEGRRDVFEMLDALPEKKQQEIQRALHLFSMGPSLPKTLQQARKHTYHFWDTQPVPRLGETIETHGPIAEGEASFRTEPFSLPQGFSWDSLDLSSPVVLRELCDLLNENYMEEDDNTIKFDFSPDYLQWALKPPNCLPQWHCGVRVDTNKKLVGFIAAVPADVRIYETEKRMVQVKFLCVHKKLRLKRMTPVLIRELSRRVNQQGIQQAVYTAGIVLPTPLSSCRYWHRPLNPRKLTDVSFPGVRQNMSLQRSLKLNRLPQVTKTPGLRPMTAADISGIHALLRENFQRFLLSPVWSLQDVEHWLLPREGVVDTYLVEADDGNLTDVVSFHTVSHKVLNHPVHSSLRAAVLLYVASRATDLVDLMEDTLVLAKSMGVDLFSALDVMDNKNFLEKLKFTVHDLSLHYYLYNWKCPSVSPDKVGLVTPN